MSKKVKKQQKQKSKLQGLLDSAKAKLSGLSWKKAAVGAAVLGALAYGGHKVAADSYVDGRVNGCSTVTQLLVNPLLKPSCVIKNGKLAIHAVNPFTNEDIFVDASTGEKIAN